MFTNNAICGTTEDARVMILYYMFIIKYLSKKYFVCFLMDVARFELELLMFSQFWVFSNENT